MSPRSSKLRLLEPRLPCERDPKRPEAFDVGKPLGGFARRQRQDHGRDFAADQPVDRAGFYFAELDFRGAAAIGAALTLPLAADCFSSIAMFLLFRSDNELISGRARTSATRLSRLSGDADAVLSVAGLTGSHCRNYGDSVDCTP